jgi:hypothetical protein
MPSTAVVTSSTSASATTASQASSIVKLLNLAYNHLTNEMPDILDELLVQKLIISTMASAACFWAATAIHGPNDRFCSFLRCYHRMTRER